MDALVVGLVKIGLAIVVSLCTVNPIMLVLVGICAFIGATDIFFEVVELGGEL